MSKPKALEIFEVDPNRKPSFLSNKWTVITTSAFGFSFVCFYNWFNRRPIMSGIQMHMLGTTVGAVGGYFIEERRLKYLAERDAILKNYIELHLEDFPVPERKKYAELIEPWIPVR